MKYAFLALTLFLAVPTVCFGQWTITSVRSTPMEQSGDKQSASQVTASQEAADFLLDCTIRNESDRTLYVQGMAPEWFLVEAFTAAKGDSVWERQNTGVDRELSMLPVAAGADIKVRRRESRRRIGDSMLLTFMMSHSESDAGARVLLGPFRIPKIVADPSASEPPSRPRLDRPVDFSGFEKFVSRVLKEWQVPGVAIAVIDDNEVVHAEGYGYRDLEEQLPVTSQTLFPIASITKPFTSTATAILVDDGKLNWDDRVREHLRAFKLYDADATEHLTIRDCLSHRTGLPYGPFHWYGINGWPEENMSPKIAYQKLRYFKQARPFRTAYEYSNSGYFIMGQVIEKLSGKPYAEFVQQQVLDPLAMQRTNFSIVQSLSDPNHAKPYDRYEGEIVRRKFFPGQVVAPAGGINSTIEDMAKFLQLYLDYGTRNGEQVVSKRQTKELFTPEVILPELNFYASTKGFQSIGWQVLVIDGEKWGRHTGSLPGFTSVASFCPERKCGYVVLTNLARRPTAELIESNIRNRLRRQPPTDQFEVFRKIEKQDHETYEKSRQQRRPERIAGTNPSHSLEDFVGVYRCPGHGDFEVALNGGMLSWQAIGFQGTLKHYHYDVFDMEGDRSFNGTADIDIAKELITFHTGRDGKVDSLSYPTPTVPSRLYTKTSVSKK